MIKPFDKNNVFTYVDNDINDKYNMKDGANLLELTGGKKERWTSVSENVPTTFDNSPKILYNFTDISKLLFASSSVIIYASYL